MEESKVGGRRRERRGGGRAARRVEETRSFVKREKGEITRRRCVGDEGVVMRGLL